MVITLTPEGNKRLRNPCRNKLKRLCRTVHIVRSAAAFSRHRSNGRNASTFFGFEIFREECQQRRSGNKISIQLAQCQWHGMFTLFLVQHRAVRQQHGIEVRQLFLRVREHLGMRREIARSAVNTATFTAPLVSRSAASAVRCSAERATSSSSTPSLISRRCTSCAMPDVAPRITAFFMIVPASR